jgi:hypothetical protein
MSEKNGNRYASRTYWLCWGIVIAATWLTRGQALDGAGFVTLALGVLAAWQSRRAFDNKLEADARKEAGR